MLSQIQQLKDRLEHDNEEPLTGVEIAYLESIETTEDITKFDHSDELMVALAYDVAKALGLSETKALIATGEIPAEHATIIKLYYHDGEYLSGYTLHGQEAKLLEQIGLAKYVSGWGYHVKDEIVNKLGEEFEYRAAWELAQPAIQIKQITEQLEQERIEKIFAEAKLTGRRVELESYSDECNDPREECSLDTVTVYAMPDGTRKTVRNHTW